VKFVLWFLCLLSLTFVFIYAFDVMVCWWKPKVTSFFYCNAEQQHLHPVLHCVYFSGQHSDMTAGINRRLQEIGCPACSVLFIDLFLALSFWSQFIYFSFTVFFSASLSGLYFLCMAKLLPFLSFHFFFLSSHSSITIIKSSDSQCVVCSCITSQVWRNQTLY
jgi:hypothetical protein